MPLNLGFPAIYEVKASGQACDVRKLVELMRLHRRSADVQIHGCHFLGRLSLRSDFIARYIAQEAGIDAIVGITLHSFPLHATFSIMLVCKDFCWPSDHISRVLSAGLL